MNGFSLIEVIVVMAMMAIIASSTLFFSFRFYNQELLLAEKSNLLVLLQNTRARAMQNLNESSHGVAIDPDNYVGYVVFSGKSFEESILDKRSYVPRAKEFRFSPNTPEEITFSQIEGKSNFQDTLSIVGSKDLTSTTVTINYEGAIY